jgi:ribosomal protein S4E
MTRRTLLAALTAVPLLRAQKKNTQKKGPDVELVEATAHVEERRVNVDGRVRNTSERPIRKLNFILEMLDSDRRVLTRQQGRIDEDTLDPGDEAMFRAQMAWHARAVAFRVEFEDGGGRELMAQNTGPFHIE